MIPMNAGGSQRPDLPRALSQTTKTERNPRSFNHHRHHHNGRPDGRDAPYSRSNHDLRRGYYTGSPVCGVQQQQHATYSGRRTASMSYLGGGAQNRLGSSSPRPGVPRDYPPVSGIDDYGGGGDDNHTREGREREQAPPPPTPIVFGDPESGSVTTGASQQELLRKKIKSKRTWRENKRFPKKKKKKKADRIINLPPSFMAGSSSQSPSPPSPSPPSPARYVRGANEIDHPQQKNRVRSRIQSPLVRFRGPWDVSPTKIGPLSGSSGRRLWVNDAAAVDHDDENDEASTAESTKESSGDIPLPAQLRNGGAASAAADFRSGYPTTYSSVPVQGAVVNEAQVEEWLDGAADAILENASPGRSRSLPGEEDESSSLFSFPLLSTNAAGGFVTGLQEECADYVAADAAESLVDPSFESEQQQQEDCMEDHQHQQRQRRGVRFAENVLVSEPLAYDGAAARGEGEEDGSQSPEAPWDEPSSHVSPTSVADVPEHSHLHSHASPLCPAPSQRPKSILRPAKFTDVVRQCRGGNRFFLQEPGDPRAQQPVEITDCHLPPSRMAGSPLPNTHSRPAGYEPMLGGDDHCPPQCERRNVSFVPLERNGDEDQDNDNDDKNPVHLQRREYGSESNPDPDYDRMLQTVGSDAPYHYPDPSLEDILQMDDESTAASSSGGRSFFIEAVASVVIQTAARRFLARLLVRALWRRRRAPGTRPSSSATAVPEDSIQEGRNKDEEDDYDGDCNREDQSNFEDVAIRIYFSAAIRIQSAFRGFWVRDCLSVDHYCASLIQAAFRGFTSRNDFYLNLYRIIITQSCWRRREAGRVAAHRLESVLRIQSAYRVSRGRRRTPHGDGNGGGDRSLWIAPSASPRQGSFCRSPQSPRLAGSVGRSPPPPSSRRREHDAAIVIQSKWRSFSCEIAFVRDVVDILIVQTLIRRWLAATRVRAIRKFAKRMRQKKVATAAAASGCVLSCSPRTSRQRKEDKSEWTVLRRSGGGGTAHDVCSERKDGDSGDDDYETSDRPRGDWAGSDFLVPRDGLRNTLVDDLGTARGTHRDVLSLWRDREKRNALDQRK